jgi:hypothetical protein
MEVQRHYIEQSLNIFFFGQKKYRGWERLDEVAKGAK